MATQEVIIDFDENFEPIISVKGVAGKSCKDLTRDLEKGLGQVVEDKLTPEYHKTEVKNAQRISSKN